MGEAHSSGLGLGESLPDLSSTFCGIIGGDGVHTDIIASIAPTSTPNENRKGQKQKGNT